MSEERKQMTIGEAQTLLNILRSDYLAKAPTTEPEQLWQDRMRIIELTQAIELSVLLSPMVSGWWNEVKNVPTGRGP